MSAYRFEQGKMVEVAVVNTQAEAELLKMTLAAHGFQVQISAPSNVYPSVDFVEGRHILARMAEEHLVRDVLRKLATGEPPRPPDV
jgi:hypothetical protein